MKVIRKNKKPVTPANSSLLQIPSISKPPPSEAIQIPNKNESTTIPLPKMPTSSSPTSTSFNDINAFESRLQNVGLLQDNLWKPASPLSPLTQQTPSITPHPLQDLAFGIMVCLLSKSHLLLDGGNLSEENYNHIIPNLKSLIPLLCSGMRVSFMDVTTHSTPTDIVMSLIVEHQSSPRGASGSSYKRDPSFGRIKSHPTSPKLSGRSTTEERKKTIGYFDHGKEMDLEKLTPPSGVDGASISKKGKEKEKERTPHLSPPSLASNEDRDNNTEKGGFFTIFLVQNIHLASPSTLQGFYNIMSQGSLAFQGHSYTIPPLFMIIAVTPLTEIIKGMEDYFLFRIALEGPLKVSHSPVGQKLAAFEIAEVIKMIDSLHDVFVSQDVYQYIRTLVVELRNDSVVYKGPSTHAVSSLVKASSSSALLNSLGYVTPQHVKSIAIQALNHHLVLRSIENPNSPALKIVDKREASSSSVERNKTVSILCGIVKTIMISLIPPV